jgi:hypothetical protein
MTVDEGFWWGITSWMAVRVGEASTDGLGEVEDPRGSWVRGDGAKNTSLDGGAVPRPPARAVEDGIWGDLGCGIIVVLSGFDKPKR